MPSYQILEAIAQFFGVPATYFSKEMTDTEAELHAELQQSIRDAGVRRIALRSSGLSEQSLRSVMRIIDDYRRLEGLDPAPGEPPGEPSQ